MQVHIIIYIRDPACARWYAYTGINIILLTEPTYKMGSYNKCIKQKKAREITNEIPGFTFGFAIQKHNT